MQLFTEKGLLFTDLHDRLSADNDGALTEEVSMNTSTMRAYIGIKFHPDDRNRETIELVSQALASCGFETICVRRDIEKWGTVTLSPQELMTKTFEIIRACHLVVIDLTEKGVGLGIEAGYAYAQAIPVITIARESSDISDTLRGISQAVCFYGSPADLRECFTQLRMSGTTEVRLE